MAAIVVPFGCRSRVRTASCLVPPRVEPRGTVLGLTGPFARLLARATSVFPEVLLCGIFRIAVGCDGTKRRHHRSPAVAPSPAGQRSLMGHRPLSRYDDSDALFAAEVHSFLRRKLRANLRVFERDHLHRRSARPQIFGTTIAIETRRNVYPRIVITPSQRAHSCRVSRVVRAVPSIVRERDETRESYAAASGENRES